MIPPERAVVRHSITVNASQETAFATFTGGHDRWWPRDFHFGGAELEEAVPEGRERTRVELERSRPRRIRRRNGSDAGSVRLGVARHPGRLCGGRGGNLRWGITWNTTVRPGAVEAVAAIVVGYLVGAATALGLTKGATLSRSGP